MLFNIKSKMVKGKKAVIGTTMTWFVAMGIIIFFLVIYLLYVALADLANRATYPYGAGFYEGNERGYFDLEITDNLVDMLGVSTEFNGKKENLKELLVMSNGEFYLRRIDAATIEGDVKYDSFKRFSEDSLYSLDNNFGDSCYLMCIYFRPEIAYQGAQAFIGQNCAYHMIGYSRMIDEDLCGDVSKKYSNEDLTKLKLRYSEITLIQPENRNKIKIKLFVGDIKNVI